MSAAATDDADADTDPGTLGLDAAGWPCRGGFDWGGVIDTL